MRTGRNKQNSSNHSGAPPTPIGNSRRRFLATSAAAIGLASLGAPSAMGDYQVRRQLMPLVKPGTVVAGNQAPEGWSHLIIKSTPRCAHGDIANLGKLQAQMASLLTTCLVADVRRSTKNPGMFILNRVAGAVTKDISGRHVAITPETQKQLGANLGFLEGKLLKEFVKEQKTVAFIGRGAQFAMFDTPIVLRVGGKAGRNVEKVLRYAIIVDAKTGRLETFCWTLNLRNGRPVAAEGDMQWLPNNHVINCSLWVDQREINFVGIPSKIAFACLSIPPGQAKVPLARTQGAAALLGKPSYTSDECKQVHGWLAGIVQQQARQARAPRAPSQ